MSERTNAFENSIANSFSIGDRLPNSIPKWMIDMGIVPGDTVLEILKMGASGGKTDILIRFNQGNPIKISAKLACADYFGNWYSHERIMKEFGLTVFNKLTASCTRWANEWLYNDNASFFIGVSISFGKRIGNTGVNFTTIFDFENIKTIVAGNGFTDDVANCLLVSDTPPASLEKLIEMLKPIDVDTISNLSRDFKVIYRPVNTQTEGTNRGKCTFTQFQPKERSNFLIYVSTLAQLQYLGSFIEVMPNSLNHNRLAKELKDKYNLNIAVRDH